jgi:phage tail protein X
MAKKFYTTIDGDELDLIAFREYGVSSDVTEVLYDINYRIADNPIRMPFGVEVELPKQTPPALAKYIKLWS